MVGRNRWCIWEGGPKRGGIPDSKDGAVKLRLKNKFWAFRERESFGETPTVPTQYSVRRAAGMRAHTHNLLLPQPSLFSKAVGFLVVRSSVAEQLALLCRTLEKRR
jgi:hypothetical protein